MKEVLSQYNVRYAYVDICENTTMLKLFMKLRDTSPAYEGVREEHRIGIPALVVDGEAHLLNDGEDAERIVKELHLGDA